MLRRVLSGLRILVLFVVGYAVLFLVYAWFTFTFWQVLPVAFLPSGPEVALLLLIAMPLYFLPAIIGRKKRNARALLALNLLAGWTFIGWVAAFVWALLRDSPAASHSANQT